MKEIVNLVGEIWKDIPGCEGYQISNYDRVKSLDYHGRGYEGLLTVDINSKGYLRFRIKKRHMLIHVAKARAFIPNHENKPCVDHKDGNKTNNKIENLRWCTHKENSNNPITLKRMSEKKKGKFVNRPDISTQVIQFDLDGIFITEYPSIAEASRQTGVSKGNICSCCKGNYKSAGGFKWSYK